MGGAVFGMIRAVHRQRGLRLRNPRDDGGALAAARMDDAFESTRPNRHFETNRERRRGRSERSSPERTDDFDFHDARRSPITGRTGGKPVEGGSAGHPKEYFTKAWDVGVTEEKIDSGIEVFKKRGLSTGRHCMQHTDYTTRNLLH